MSLDQSERRAFQRHPVSLQGALLPPGQAAIACEILDFCMGGLLVALNDITVGSVSPGQGLRYGDQVCIHTDVDLAGVRRELAFNARLVRVTPSRLGLSFMNPDFSALQVLHELAQAQAHNDRPAVESSPGSRQLVPGAQQIFSECAATVQRQTPIMVTDFLSVIIDRLMDAADASASMPDQSAYFSAANVFRKNKAVIETGFTTALKAIVDGMNIEQLQVAEDRQELPQNGPLSLVEDSALEHWLAVTEIERQVESEWRGVLYGLEQRLSRLVGHEIKAHSNPFGPALFARAFQQGVGGLPLEHHAEVYAHGVFTEQAVKRAGVIYQALNDFLDSQGLKPEAPAPRKSTAPVRAQPRDIEADTPAAVPATDATAGATQASAMPQHHRATTSSTPLPAATRSDRPAAGVGRSVSPRQEGLFSLIDTLQVLKTQSFSRAAAASGPDDIDARAPETYTREEIVQALSLLQGMQGPGHPGLSQLQDISASVAEVLRREDSSHPPRSLGEDEARLVNVTGDLLKAVLTDRMMSAESRSWLQRIEPVLLKLAVADEDFLRDKSHVARQVVNKLAQIDLSSAPSYEDIDIRSAVENLVALIEQDFDGSPEVFNQSLDALEQLAQVRERRFTDNLRHLTAELNSTPALCQFPKPTPGELNALSNDGRTWLKYVQRLRPGNSVFFEDGDIPTRLRVGWTNDMHSYYVFVNAEGGKAREEAALDLALLLAGGRAELASDIDEEPIDRAQFGLLQDIHAEFRQNANRDPLTGAANWREFARRCRTAQIRCQTEQAVHSLCHLDVDHFRMVNSRWGHETGDELLAQLYRKLSSRLDDSVCIARMSSDEFAILFEDTVLEQAVSQAQGLLADVAATSFRCGGGDINLNLSAGLIELDASAPDIEDYMRAVESGSAMAKKRGKNHVQTVQLGDISVAKQRTVMQWAAQVDELLDAGRFSLMCQHIRALNPGSGYADHYEVLLRFKDEQGTPVSAADLIMAVEEYGRISSIDRWVVKQTLQWMAANRGRLAEIGGLSINLSGQSISDEGFLDFVLEQLAAADVPLDKVCFEITETAGVTNLSDAASFILEMKDTGCSFSLDDFGTGMSSYAYLKNLPVDYLKIDGTFIKDLLDTPSDYAMVKSITEIGHFMGMRIIAEFVQDEETVEELRGIGVDYGQGYGIARPVPMEQLFDAVA